MHRRGDSSTYRDVRDVHVLCYPGYMDDQPLSTNLTALVGHQADAIQQLIPSGDPFAVIGNSSGGYIAHSIVRRLEELGAAPTGLILLDTLRPSRLTAETLEAHLRHWARILEVSPREDIELTAGAWYQKLILAWLSEPIATPTLFVRCADGISHDDPHCRNAHYSKTNGTNYWDLPHDLTVVPGDHYQIITTHAESTVRVVSDWLTSLPGISQHSHR